MEKIELLPGRKYAPKNLGRVLVLGLGKSGRAAIDYLAPLVGERMQSLAVAAGSRAGASNETLEYVEALRARGLRVEFDHEVIEGAYDLCIASPGISQFSAFYESAAAASVEVISEVEFAWRESAADAVWVAVTGTNGKTTTTSLAAHLLQVAGMKAHAVGNIGDTCLRAVAAGATEVYVAETSSYQLASTSRFAPNVAVLLNITPDHLAWHKSHEAYVAAKLKVLANLANVPGSVAVLDATNDTVRATVRALRAQAPEERGFSYVPVGTAAGLSESMIDRCGAENAAYVRDGRLHVNMGGTDHDLGPDSTLQIKGPHNVSNALAAAACAVALRVSDEVIREGLATFAPLEHRIEPCGSVAGVACYNDSKATNVDATLVALSAFAPGSIVVLLGGRDKGTDLAPLVERARRTCKAVVLFGESRARFAEAFGVEQAAEVDESAGAVREDFGNAQSPSETLRSSDPSVGREDFDGAHQASSARAGQSGGLSVRAGLSERLGVGEILPGGGDAQVMQVLLADHLEDALDVALSVASAGDEVLLSPACASFDEFTCFEERGCVFKELVAKRAAAAEGTGAEIASATGAGN